jgi:DNA (cytosine-5)-methyltransferase 1
MKTALDLFCGAGGASMGLHDAGFEVVGVDIEPQPSYPFEFVQRNVLDLLLIDPRSVDFVWASPPCQAFTAYKRRPDHVYESPNLIPATRELLQDSGLPYVIENIPGARTELVDPIQLCGSSFGLDVRRHRLFECSFPIKAPPCDHSWQTPRFPPATNRTNKRCTVEVGVWRIPLEVQQKAMGIDWMTRKELSQAIPPAYAEYIAKEVIRFLDRGRPQGAS